MKRVALCSIAALLLGLAAWSPGAEAFGPPQLAYRSGNYRIAASALEDALKERPDDLELHARLGVTYALMGDFVEAAPHLERAQGSELYEDEAWSHHADTLRALGEGAQAFTMRAERLTQLLAEGRLVSTRCDMVDDLRAMGELDAALELAELTLTLHPYSNLARATRLDVALDRGDEDADAIAAWMQRDLAQSTRSIRALSRMAMLEGDLPQARALLEAIPRQNKLYAPIIAQQAELERLSGEPEEALWTLDRPMVRTPNHPELLAVRARVLADLGRDEEALALCRQALSSYPFEASISETSRQLGCR
ncbi:MAG: tetratricopeptide repeat protein [Alphaproteobacteria bacterium]|nr:tetratricopeptide repeat protein [Alphaproteobacteria bacterium]MCB9792249.1 tetratricopeptide repeat protein [Alphaproteobacteria bacterium]